MNQDNESLPALRPYQRAIARAVLESVLRQRGLTITVEIARQGGTNEVAAQVEMYLLAAHAGRGGEIVKCAPTRDPQLTISMRRLRSCFAGAGLPVKHDGGSMRMGRAAIHFLSADPGAHVVGHTASILLAADEAQDVDAETFDRDFRPMGAAHNVTTVLYGTSWDDRTLLERSRQSSLEAERRDGIRRVFRYPWWIVAQHVPGYAAYVQGERERLGERHPLFLTQYCLETISGGGRLFTAAETLALRGAHDRMRVPAKGESYVAGLDIAGGGDDGPDGGRDSTVLTIGRLSFPDHSDAITEPRVEIVEHVAWTGTPHEHLAPQIIDALRSAWRVDRVVVDATGIGETIARLLGSALGSGRVEALKFTAESKSRLGFELLAAVQGARLKMYAGDASPEYAEFFRQAERARAEYRPNRSMNFFVDEREGHDDYLVSAALLVHAGRSRTRRAAVGRMREAV